MRFTHEHRGKLVTIEVEEGERRKSMAVSAPFEGVSWNEDEPARARVVVRGVDRATEIIIAEPTRFELVQHEEREGGMLRVDTQHAGTVLLRFSEPLVPGIMDALP